MGEITAIEGMGYLPEDQTMEEEILESYEPMTDEELVNIVQREISEAVGENDDINVHYSKAMDYFFAKPNGTEIEGRSKTVDSSIQDAVEACLAQIMPPLTSGDFASFSAISPEDEKQAQIESDYVNDVIVNQNNGYVLLLSAIKDALILKNGIIKVYVDEDIDVQTEKFENLSQYEMQKELQPKRQGEEVRIITEVIDQDELGNPMYSMVINRVNSNRKLSLGVVPPEQFLFQSGHNSIDLQNCGFACHKQIYRRFELIEMGFDPALVNELKKVENISGSSNTGTYSRSQFHSETEHKSTTLETDPVEIHDCAIRVDWDKDGVAELRRVVISGNVLLHNETLCITCFAAGTGFIMSHRFLGMSFYDKLKDNQDNKTKVTRQYWDNLDANNNRRMGVDTRGISDPDSLLESKPAGVIKCKRDPSTVLMPVPVDDIGPSCINALDYLDRQRTEKVGAAVDMQSQQTQVSADTAHGVERLVSAREEMSAMIATTIGKTLITQLYTIVHKMLRENFPYPVHFQSRGEWVETNPAQWLPRNRVKINEETSKGEKIQKVNALNQLLSKQMEVLQAGEEGVLIDKNKIYNTQADLVKVSGIGHPSRYWIDPQSTSAQQVENMKQQHQQEMQAKEQALQDSQTQLQAAIGQAEVLKAQNGTMNAQIKELQVALDARDKANDLQFKYDKLYEETATKLLELGMDINAQIDASKKLDKENG